MNQSPEPTTADESPPHWRPLSRSQRRVAGVLVEKAKTTPDGYPLSLNALTNGCNQKSNRAPQLNLSADQVQDAVDELRAMGAVAEVQSSGRVPKYRHYMKDWLGVEAVELAVMTELLLRGEQTLGELRGRAARMEPIADVNALRPVIQSLADMGLVVALTPAGRGQIVTHNLYDQDELDRLRQRIGGGSYQVDTSDLSSAPEAIPTAAASTTVAPTAAAAESVGDQPSQGVSNGELLEELETLRAEVSELRDAVENLQADFRELTG